MINVTALIQLKAFARQDGFLLFLLWIASFAVIVTNPMSSWGSLLAMATPFYVGYLLARFRNYALDGAISFRRGLAFSLYTFFYASLLFAVAQYVYFRFLDNGALMTMLIASVKTLEPFYKAQGISVNELQNSLSMIGQLSPIEVAFVFMMQNILIGAVLSFPIAWIGKRTIIRKNLHHGEQFNNNMNNNDINHDDAGNDRNNL
jgi:hypothetical protein